MGKECYIMARPCFVLFLRFLRSRSFFLLYLLYTYKYIKRMLNTVVNYFHSLWLASCGLAAAMLDSQAKIRRTPATKEDRPTSNSLSVSCFRSLVYLQSVTYFAAEQTMPTSLFGNRYDRKIVLKGSLFSTTTTEVGTSLQLPTSMLHFTLKGLHTSSYLGR